MAALPSPPATFPSLECYTQLTENSKWPTVVDGKWEWAHPPRGLRVVGEVECNSDYYAVQFALVDRRGDVHAMFDFFYRDDWEVTVAQDDGNYYRYDEHGLVSRNPIIDWVVTKRMLEQKEPTMWLNSEFGYYMSDKKKKRASST